MNGKLYSSSSKSERPTSSELTQIDFFRLVLARNRNSSCGRLCDHDYEEHGLLMHQQDHAKAKAFGSTPLFTRYGHYQLLK